MRNGLTSQDEDSGHHILRDPPGKMRKSHRIPWESTGNSSEMEAVFRPEDFWIFFGEFLPVACAFRWILTVSGPYYCARYTVRKRPRFDRPQGAKSFCSLLLLISIIGFEFSSIILNENC